jgi:glycosyltransferase involved in cell wall biosynthesis
MSDGSSLPLSIVVPVYNEAGNVGPLHAELTRVARALETPYEILFVNDGSRDDTLDTLRALAARDPCLRIVDLDGNFGEAAALSAGFAHARGEIVVTLDGDGQNDPEAIPRLLAALAPDVDVVSGRRRNRKERLLTRVLPSRVANWLIVQATGVPVYDCGCGLKAYRRDVLRDALLPRGMNRFLPAILGVDPARVREIPVTDRVRGSGQSHYGLSRVFVVLRDLLSLPILCRRPPRSRALGHALGGAQALLALVSVVAVIGALGFPADRVVAAVVALAAALAALAGWAIRHNVTRWVAAREGGVFRVRRVIE